MSGVGGAIPGLCTVRSKLNKFEHVGGGEGAGDQSPHDFHNYLLFHIFQQRLIISPEVMRKINLVENIFTNPSSISLTF